MYENVEVKKRKKKGGGYMCALCRAELVVYRLSRVRTRVELTIISTSSSNKMSPPDWYDTAAALAGPEEERERERNDVRTFS